MLFLTALPTRQDGAENGDKAYDQLPILGFGRERFLCESHAILILICFHLQDRQKLWESPSFESYS